MELAGTPLAFNYSTAWAGNVQTREGGMLNARNELKLRDRVGLFGPSVVVVMALIAIAMLARDAMG